MSCLFKCLRKNPNDYNVTQLNYSPTTSISILLETIFEGIGAEDSENHAAHYIELMQREWHYRVIDLLEVDAQVWERLNLPAVIQNELTKYIEVCRQNIEFTNFKETDEPMKTNDMRVFLDHFRSQNPSAVHDIDKVEAICGQSLLYNIDLFKKYFVKSHFDALGIPFRFKILLSRKLSLHYYKANHNMPQHHEPAHAHVEREPGQPITDNGEKKQLKHEDGNHIDGATTLKEVSRILATRFLMDDGNEIYKELQPLIDSKYHRIYHLSTISDDLYNQLLSDARECLRCELYDIITEQRVTYRNLNRTLPFYVYSSKKRRSSDRKEQNLLATMSTVVAFELLEKDIGLNAGELLADCNELMDHFYSNLWDWFFIKEHFWTQLPYYSKYAVVRVRINHLMRQIMDKGGVVMTKRPIVPRLWADKYDGNLSIEQVLFNKSKREFSLDGLDHSEYTKEVRKKIYEFMNLNLVKKLQFVSVEQIKNNEQWTNFMTQYNFPSHIRFKIDFYSVKGEIVSDDVWLNDYIRNYPHFPPQYRSMNGGEEWIIEGSDGGSAEGQTEMIPLFCV